MGKVTIKDIAREAGGSISTVSNALNGVSVLKPETREHILEVADRLHYVPNLAGRNLKSKSTKVIGLFTTSLKGPYFATLADTVFWECRKYGYELNIFVTWNAKSAVTSILGKRVDGSIILDNDIGQTEVKNIEEFDIPVVFLDREVQGNRMSSILFDSYRDGEIAAEYIMKKGLRRIAYVEGISINYDSIERSRGFRDRLAKGGIVLDPDYILYGDFERAKAHDSMVEFLSKGLPLPEIVFASNDLSAMGCMNALVENGYSVPGDVMIMGVDDIEMCEYYNPPLTTIRTGYEKQAAMAVEKLVKMISGEEKGDITKLHGKLIERESTNSESRIYT